MKRRIGIIGLAVLGLTLGGSAAQAVGEARTLSNYWGCVVVDRADAAVCLKNPLPERLPVPSGSEAPGVPS